MKRRDVLKLAGAGTVGLVLPGGIERWFLGPGVPFAPEGEGQGEPEAALKRAREAGKPLLVLVIPVKDKEKRERGRLFGGLLNWTGDEILADLALCEIACAPVETLRDALKVEGLSGEPLAVLVETSGGGLRARAIDPELPPEVSTRGRELGQRGEAERSASNRIARLAEAIRAAVAPDRTAIAALAAAAEVGLTPEQKVALTAMVEGEVDVALADRGAAILRLLAEVEPTRRPRVLQALRPAALARLRWKAPPGAKWAYSKGCGTRVEGDDTGGVIGCGMGYVPEASQRFLWFFTDR
ncbi:MAG: hypothetical protein L0323_08465 [Planctomycetes bacterium]|nr:hypothetical protein [Planctomycetota bacterium]